MDHKFGIIVALAATVAIGNAQVASHAPALQKPAPSGMPSMTTAIAQPTGKPVARINGVVMTDRDLLREMMTIFPYARTHNGFPKGQEAMIRQGALQMIEFEELVYQEASKRHMTVAPERVNKAVNAFRAQFQSQEEFEQYLKIEMNGSLDQFRKSVRRSLLIEAFQKSQLDLPSRVTPTQTREFYTSNAKQFMHPEEIQFQTISVMPPENATSDVKEKARKHVHEIWGQAKNTRTYDDFGLMAEKYSEDDFRVDMGNHKMAARPEIPEPVLKILDAMKPGQVSDVCQFGPYYVIFRLEARKPAGKTPFEEVRAKLQEDLHKEKYNKLRGELDKKLRASAKIEEL
jgi:parvulin-like peptidyl-prolyl isomerase